ncbi:hypothetical protein [Virgisporangium ochraceum]|nr:hypothetical protein [Virgisporangium ochraceum]
MIKALNRLGDRMVGRFVPRITAAANHCYTERCCGQKSCRYCCHHEVLGTTCQAWYYC